MLFGKSIVIITGASRGIGREIAVQAAKQVAPGSVFILTARNDQLLSKIKEELFKINGAAIIETFASNLENYHKEEEQAKLQEALERHSRTSFDSLLLFHNAGTTGDVSKAASQLNDASSWNNYMAVNFTSMVQINNQILESLKETKIKKRIVVNITSLVAIRGFPSLCQYSVGKAARESFFRVLAAECPDLRILSYSPGPVDTDMHDSVAKDSFDAGIRAAFSRDAASSEANRSTLTPTQTVTKMVKYLQENDYESGSRVDYFDLE